MDSSIINKLKEARSLDDFLAIAKENGIDIKEKGQELFEKVKSGEAQELLEKLPMGDKLSETVKGVLDKIK